MDHCSSDCIKGTIHPGQPQGTEELIHGLNTYVVGNRTSPRGIIVIYSDVFGLALPNNKLIADAYARSGDWLVYLPDFFEGDPLAPALADLLIPVDPSKQGTIRKYTGLLASLPSFLLWSARHTDARSDATCMTFLRSLRRATPPAQKIGMSGFCWGGKYAIRAGLAGNMIDVDGLKVPLVDAVVALHPSHVAVPGDVQELVVPVSFGWGLTDSVVKFEQKARIEEIHGKSLEAGRQQPEMAHKVYRPGRHGFAVRGNPDDPPEKACLEESEAQALDWFDRWI